MKIFLRLFILIFLISISTSCTSFSQESDSKSSDSSQVRNSLKKGMWAIQFAIGEDFTLTNFEGAVLSLKYHLASKTALRLSFNGSYSKIENDSNEFDYLQSNSFGVNLIFMYYLNPKSRFNIFLYGGGVYNNSYNVQQNSSYYTDVSSWTAGPLLGAGAEFFVFNQLSLFAEYSYSFLFGKENYSYYGYPSGIQDRRVYNITFFYSDAVKFGLSVYF